MRPSAGNRTGAAARPAYPAAVPGPLACPLQPARARPPTRLPCSSQPAYPAAVPGPLSLPLATAFRARPRLAYPAAAPGPGLPPCDSVFERAPDSPTLQLPTGLPRNPPQEEAFAPARAGSIDRPPLPEVHVPPAPPDRLTLQPVGRKRAVSERGAERPAHNSPRPRSAYPAAPEGQENGKGAPPPPPPPTTTNDNRRKKAPGASTRALFSP